MRKKSNIIKHGISHNLQRDITSSYNPRYRQLKALLESKGISKHGCALISGKKAVGEIARTHPGRVVNWVIRSGERRPETPWSESGVGCLVLDKKLFSSIDIWGTLSPLLVVRVGPFPVWEDKDPADGCTLFIPFQDPANVGSVIRSAAAFGVSRVVLLKEAAHPFHPKSSRAASGVLFQIPVFQGPSIRELSCRSVELFTLDSDGEDIKAINFPPKFALLPGLEGPGIPQYLKTQKSILIPMEPGVESLNAATATAIVLHCWYEKKNEP